jgi:multidrug transporter EmrE-like cation transporter
MQTSRLVAGILGPVLTATVVTEGLNWSIWAGNTPVGVYLNGLMLFGAGVTILRFHNRWTSRWPLLVTLCGWVLAAVGLMRMTWPKVDPPSDGPALWTGLTALTLLGLFLTWQGWRPVRQASFPPTSG